jgi:hypothetical protein
MHQIILRPVYTLGTIGDNLNVGIALNVLVSNIIVVRAEWDMIYRVD